MTKLRFCLNVRTETQPRTFFEWPRIVSVHTDICTSLTLETIGTSTYRIGFAGQKELYELLCALVCRHQAPESVEVVMSDDEADGESEAA